MPTKSRPKQRRRQGGSGLQDLAEVGQQFMSEASGRAEDALRRARKQVQDTVRTLEKRRDAEMKNLRARLQDLNINVSGLERRYRTLEKRVEKQLQTLSKRTLRATDFEKRMRGLEADIRRYAGLGARTTAGPTRGTAAKAKAARRKSGPKRAAAKRRAKTAVRTAKTTRRRKAAPARPAATTTAPTSGGESSTT
jgi:chromosome segregation ATPase